MHIIFKLALSRPQRYYFSHLRHSSNYLPKQGKDDPSELVVPRLPPVRPVIHEELKHIKTEYHDVVPNTIDENIAWYPFFKFPYPIRLRMVFRFKLYLTGVVTSLSASQIYQYFMNPTSNIGIGSLSLMSVASVLSLLFFGTVYRKFICNLYLSEDEQLVRITRFSFYANRRDIILPRERVLALAETNSKRTAELLNLRFSPPDTIDTSYDSNEFYTSNFWILPKFGGIVDPERFELVLGKFLKRVVPRKPII